MITAFDWILLVLVIITLLFLFFEVVWSKNLKSQLYNNGIAYRIQISPSFGTTDTMLTGGNTLYIGRTSSANLQLKVVANDEQTEGRYFLVRNNSNFNSTITLVGSGVSFRGTGPDGAPATSVLPGQLGWYVFTATNVAERIL